MDLRFLISPAIHQLLSSVLLRTEGEVGFVPDTLEGEAGVEDGQASGGNDNHYSFENHEERFIASEKMAVEAAGEFGAAVDTSDSDGDGGCEET